MPKLKLGTILDDRPVKLAIELPAQVNRDLIAYAEVFGRETGQTIEPAKLIAPMLARFHVNGLSICTVAASKTRARTTKSCLVASARVEPVTSNCRRPSIAPRRIRRGADEQTRDKLAP